MKENNSLENYIVKFENVIPETIYPNFLRVCKNFDYDKAKIYGDNKKETDETVRKALAYSLSDINAKSLTDIHWRNFLSFTFQNFVNDYQNLVRSGDGPFKINDIQVLKYVNMGHYKFHTDDGPQLHRRISCIYFVNDDYEGGDLEFGFLHTEKKLIIKPKKNSMVIWPSNWMYPHSVRPVTKGERYSVVAWAL